MNLPTAIQHLTEDLERYAKSGKANPKAVAFKEVVLNAVIDGINSLEERTANAVEVLNARVATLTNDLDQRDRTIAQLRGAVTVDMSWSWLEGRAQSALQYMFKQVDHEEGKSISEKVAARQRKLLDVLQYEFDVLWDELMTMDLAHGSTAIALKNLRQWCTMCGVDLREWDNISEAWHAHLPEAVSVMHQRMVVDGIITPNGIRLTGRGYRNPSAVAFNVLNAVQYDHAWRKLCRELNIELSPDYEPLYLWDVPDLPETTLSPIPETAV